MNYVTTYMESFHWEQILFETLTKIISLLLLLILFFIGKKIVLVLFEKTVISSIKRSIQNEGRQKTVVRLLDSLLNYTLYFLLIYWILSILGLPVSSLFAGAGIAGIAIGLGAQGFLSDLINGLFILLERQFDVGDFVQIAGVEGTVTMIGIRTTQLRGIDGILHFIPNRKIDIVSNQSRYDRSFFMDLPLVATTNISTVHECIQTVNNAQKGNFPEIVKGPSVIGLQVDANKQLVFRIKFVVLNGQQAAIYSSFYKLYQEQLLQAGIQLAEYPLKR